MCVLIQAGALQAVPGLLPRSVMDAACTLLGLTGAPFAISLVIAALFIIQEDVDCRAQETIRPTLPSALSSANHLMVCDNANECESQKQRNRHRSQPNEFTPGSFPGRPHISDVCYADGH